MSEVMETLAWPRRLETTTMFWPVCRGDGRMEVSEAAHGHLRVADARAEALDCAGELHGVEPPAGLVGEDAPAIKVGSAHGVLETVLLGAMLGEDVCCALVEVDDAAAAVSLRRLEDEAQSAGTDERRLDGDVAAVEIDVGPAQAEGLSAPEAGVGDEVDGRMEVVSLVAGEIESAADGADVRWRNLASGGRRRRYEGDGVSLDELHAEGVLDGAG